jgi:hypothetical protein
MTNITSLLLRVSVCSYWSVVENREVLDWLNTQEVSLILNLSKNDVGITSLASVFD